MKLNSKALITSTIGVIWLIVGMTLLGEVSGPFKSFLVQLAGHHWVGKSGIAVVVFIALYLALGKSKESEDILRGALLVALSIILGGLIIFVFFLQHFLRG
ncbi:hypothetical protein HYS79_02290 [Patescibacteria group bacterium]|nr:hypothetical protein [Patescibacteria group bacterium]